MATEVGVAVRGKPFCQALFIEESQWHLPLSEFRDLMINQQLELPSGFKFLTTNGNIVPVPLEETLTLGQVLKNPLTAQTGPANDVDNQIPDAKPPTDNRDVYEGSVPVISILPYEFAAHSTAETTPDSTNGPEQCDKEETESGRGRNCQGCPAMLIKEAFPMLQDYLQPKKFLKTIFLLSVILAGLMAALTCTLHMTMGAVGGLMGQPFFGDIFRVHPDASALTELKVQLSELEVTTRFELKDLRQKLSELEDLYLRDLEIQRRDLATVKTKQMELEQSMVKEMEYMKVTVDTIVSGWQTDETGEKKEMDKQEEGEKEKKKGKHGEKKKNKPQDEKNERKK